MNEPILSIIVPVLDEAASLASFLGALQPFRERGAELILVDGGSRDGTSELLAGACRSLVDRWLPAAAGRGWQMRQGAMVARAAVLLFLHADTSLPPNTLELLGALPRRDTLWGCFNVRLSGADYRFRVIEWFINQRSRWSGICTGDQALFVGRHLYDRAGGFAPLPLMEDIEFSRRLGRLTKPVRIDSAVVTSSRRWEQRGVWATVWLMWSLRLAYFLGTPATRLAARYRRDPG